MKAKNMVPLALVVFSGLFLSGCGKIWNCINNPGQCLLDALKDENWLEVLTTKYWPTDSWGIPWWLWLLIAIPAGYLFMRTPKSRLKTIKYAIGVLAISLVPFIWRIVDAWVAVIILVIVKSTLLKIIHSAGFFKGKTGWIYDIYKSRTTEMDKELEQEMAKRGIQPEKKLGQLEIFGGIGTVFLLLILFGGELVDKPETFFEKYDYFLRVVGILLSMAGILYFFITDLPKARWECVNPYCGDLNWDWQGNAKECEHCEFPNPVTLGEWTCRHILNPDKPNYRCEEKNKGDDFYCSDCGTIRSQLKRFLEDEEDEDDNVINVKFEEHRDKPEPRPPAVLLPPSTQPKTATCKKCNKGISANAIICTFCGTKVSQPQTATKNSTKKRRENPLRKRW